jgi:hypothetical protein
MIGGALRTSQVFTILGGRLGPRMPERKNTGNPSPAEGNTHQLLFPSEPRLSTTHAADGD